MTAAESGETEVVRSLLQSGADVHAKRDDGASALTLAAREGHTEIVHLLLEAGANAKSEGWALLLASEGGHDEIVAALLQAGAPVNPGSLQWTALMGASRAGHTNIVETLLKAGADVNARDADGSSALMMAVTGGHPDIVRILLQAHAQVDDRLADGSTPLMMAAREGHVEIIQELIRGRADARLKDITGRTAAYWAIWSKNPEAIRALTQDTRTVPALITGLKDPDRNGRLSAVLSLAIPENHAAVAPLSALLNGEQDPEIRSAIITVLGTIGDSSALPPLINILKRKNKESANAIGALIKIGDPAAIPALREAFWHSETSAESVRALFALGDRNYVPAANRSRRILALAIPFLVCLFVALISIFRAQRKQAELLRLGIAIFNTIIGGVMGAFFYFVIVVMLGSALGITETRGEWALIAYLSVSYFYGYHCAFYCFLASYVRIGKLRTPGNAVILASMPVLLAPFILMTMANFFADENDPVTSRWTQIASLFHSGEISALSLLFTLGSASLAVFLNCLLAGWMLRHFRKTNTSVWDDLTFPGFLSLFLGIALIFLLHSPLARFCIYLKGW